MGGGSDRSSVEEVLVALALALLQFCETTLATNLTELFEYAQL